MGNGKLNIAIVGSSGYTGGELFRILLQHPSAAVTAVTSEKSADKPITDIFPHLLGLTDLVCEPLDPEVKGTVTNITDFGVFVDLGGVEGLIHISELSWGRVSHPNQIVSLGQEIEVQVLDVSVERCRVALSLKRMISNPWERAHSEFPVNTVLPAVVTSVLSYGAFARIDAGVEGLIHASEMPLEPNQSPRDFLRDGQQIQVRVLHLDPSHQRMGLSMHLHTAA